jgi:hypothetical protein
MCKSLFDNSPGWVIPSCGVQWRLSIGSSVIVTNFPDHQGRVIWLVRGLYPAFAKDAALRSEAGSHVIEPDVSV